MKKSKIVLAIALAVVLVMTVISVPTFSWFTRPQHQAGDKMVLQSKNVYNAYNGYDVTISTTKATNGVDYNDSANGEGDLDGDGVAAHSRNYFCTTITNNSGGDQNVSLYAAKLSIPTPSSNGSLAIGVNEPTRNYRDYSSLAHPYFTTTNNTMRVYFEKDNSVNGWNGTDFYVCWKEAGTAIDGTGSNGTYYHMTWVSDPGHPNHYYADIPRTANQLFFAVANWGTHNNGQPDYWQRSQLITNLSSDGQAWNSPKLWKITNTNNNGNATAVKYDSPGVGVDNKFSSISIAAGENTFDASLDSSWYIGGSVKYYSSDESLFTVDEDSGVITTNNNNKTGEAKLYSKVINSSNGYWDAMQVESTIQITEDGYYEFTDVPIVRNLLIPGVDDQSTTAVENQINVYWYVINNHDSNALDYEIDRLYLGM